MLCFRWWISANFNPWGFLEPSNKTQLLVYSICAQPTVHYAWMINVLSVIVCCPWGCMNANNCQGHTYLMIRESVTPSDLQTAVYYFILLPWTDPKKYFPSTFFFFAFHLGLPFNSSVCRCSARHGAAPLTLHTSVLSRLLGIFWIQVRFYACPHVCALLPSPLASSHPPSSSRVLLLLSGACILGYIMCITEMWGGLDAVVKSSELNWLK